MTPSCVGVQAVYKAWAMWRRTDLPLSPICTDKQPIIRFSSDLRGGAGDPQHHSQGGRARLFPRSTRELFPSHLPHRDITRLTHRSVEITLCGFYFQSKTVEHFRPPVSICPQMRCSFGAYFFFKLFQNLHRKRTLWKQLESHFQASFATRAAQRVLSCQVYCPGRGSASI